ncbi:MAG: hypothetical protein ACYC1M_13960 [Armatimonadota bacterium]
MKTRIAAIAATVFVMGFAGASFAGNGQMGGNQGTTQQGQQLRKRDGSCDGSGRQQGKRIQQKNGSGICPNTGLPGKGRSGNNGVCPNK